MGGHDAGEGAKAVESAKPWGGDGGRDEGGGGGGGDGGSDAGTDEGSQSSAQSPVPPQPQPRVTRLSSLPPRRRGILSVMCEAWQLGGAEEADAAGLGGGDVAGDVAGGLDGLEGDGTDGEGGCRVPLEPLRRLPLRPPSVASAEATRQLAAILHERWEAGVLSLSEDQVLGIFESLVPMSDADLEALVQQITSGAHAWVQARAQVGGGGAPPTGGVVALMLETDDDLGMESDGGDDLW